VKGNRKSPRADTGQQERKGGGKGKAPAMHVAEKGGVEGETGP